VIVITVARKPLVGSVVANIALWGVGGLNINECRIPLAGAPKSKFLQGDGYAAVGYNYNGGQSKRVSETEKLGRWPTNLILQHKVACKSCGTRQTKGKNAIIKSTKVYSCNIGPVGLKQKGLGEYGHADSDGKEMVTNWNCVEGCPCAEMTSQREQIGAYGLGFSLPPGIGASGPVVRFFKQVKE